MQTLRASAIALPFVVLAVVIGLLSALVSAAG
jgi:cell division protein FtsX